MLQLTSNVLLQHRITCCKTTQLDAHAHQPFGEADGYTPQLRHRIVPDAVATDTHWRQPIAHTEAVLRTETSGRAGNTGPWRLCDAMRCDAMRWTHNARNVGSSRAEKLTCWYIFCTYSARAARKRQLLSSRQLDLVCPVPVQTWAHMRTAAMLLAPNAAASHSSID